MVTYMELYTFCLVMIGVAGFVWTVAAHINKKK